MATDPSPAPAPTQPLSAALATELAATNFGQVLTNPLYSNVIRWALGLLVSFIGTKFFKADEATLATQDWVEMIIVFIGIVGVIYYRFVSTHQITSVVAAAEQVLPVLEKAATPAIRGALMDLLKQRNPKVYEAVVQITGANTPNNPPQ